jgi:hypothetical protein
MVDRNRAELVDDDRAAAQLRLSEQMVEQRRLATAEITGNEGHR